MKYFEPADQPELVRFGLWQKEQVGPSLRWPAWKVGRDAEGAVAVLALGVVDDGAAGR